MRKKIIDRVLAGVVLLMLMVSNISPCMAYAEESQTESNEEEYQSNMLIKEPTQEEKKDSAEEESTYSTEKTDAEEKADEHTEKNKIIVEKNDNDSVFTVRIENAETGDSGRVVFPIWGDKNGQNDIRWYEGVKVSEGIYETKVDIVNHKESGLYNVHVYTYNHGKMSFLGKTTTDIAATTVGTITCNREKSDISQGRYRIELKNIKPNNVITKVRVPVWSDQDGQDDLIWYDARQDGDTWYVDIDVSKHKYDVGEYHVHAYVTDVRGIAGYAGENVIDVEKMDINNLSVEKSEDETSMTIKLSKATVGEKATVEFPVWGEKNGQNDLVWYKAKKTGEGEYEATVQISNHKECGEYHVHAYSVLNGKKHFLTETTTVIEQNLAEISIDEEKSDKAAGTYRLVVKNIQCPVTITRVRIPVWSNENGQDDLKWYEAKQDGDIWYADIDICNHKYDSGIYNAHVYLTDSRGIYGYGGETEFEVQDIGKNQMEVTVNDEQSQITVLLKHTEENGTVQFPVWGDVNGQNDIVWYTADKIAPYTYKAVINVSKHKETGIYNIHAYMNANRSRKFLKQTTVNIEGVTGEIETNADVKTGIITVKVADLKSPSEITEVKVPVWTENKGQDDLKWYDAQKKEDGWYVDIDAYQHKQEIGKYLIHVYATDKRGFRQFVTSTEVMLDEPESSFSVKMREDNTTVDLKASGIRNANRVQMAVWGELNGQNDLKWYDLTRTKGFSYEAVMNIYDHMETGIYQCHLYVTGTDNKKRFVGKTSFQVDGFAENYLWTTNIDNTNGRFDAKIYAPKANISIDQIQVAVWTEANGQDDLKWYNASKDSNNVWTAKIDSLNHKCESGVYNVHVYAKSKDGTKEFVDKTQVQITRTTRRYQNPSQYYQIKDSISLSGGGYNLTIGYEGVKVMMVIRKLGLGSGIGMGGALYTQSTANAVARFQRSIGLPASGVVDYLTWIRMGFNQLQWTQYGSYVSPVKVNKNSTRSEHIEAMISTAYSYMGTAYVIGASGPPGTGVDCSGLVMQALYGAGLELPGINPVTHALPGHEYESRNMWNSSKFKHVSYSQRQRGDLIFYQNSKGTVIHVAIYLGNDQVIESWPNQVVVWPIRNSARSNIKGVVRPFV